MNIARRRFLHLATGAVAFPVVMRSAFAETYPARPVHLVAGFAAGSASDINARLLGQWLAEQLSQPCIIDNRAGAGGNIATEFVVRAPADGYTLLYASTAIAINETLYSGKLSFNAQKDLAPVASVVRTPVVMEVNPSFPAKTVPEFIAYAKANPGKINFATVGAGSLQHLCRKPLPAMRVIEPEPLHVKPAPGSVARNATHEIATLAHQHREWNTVRRPRIGIVEARQSGGNCRQIGSPGPSNPLSRGTPAASNCRVTSLPASSARPWPVSAGSRPSTLMERPT